MIRDIIAPAPPPTAISPLLDTSAGPYELRGPNHGSDRHDRTPDRRCRTTFPRRATRNHDPANTLIPYGAVPVDSAAT
jgi:hypothetical protein